VWAPTWFVLVSTGSLPESGLRAGGSHDGHRYEGTTKNKKATDEGRANAARVMTADPDHRVEDSSATWPRHDMRLTHAGMTGTLDVTFDKLRDASAAHHDD